MADELKRYWFIAAVYREPRDLVATIAELRAFDIAGNRLLVVANHGTEDARKALDGLDGSDCGRVPVVTMRSDGGIGAGEPFKLPVELRALLEALDGGGAAAGRLGEAGAAGSGGDGQAHVYAQLRQDVADGALVLVASVADPDEQLQGARILLRGNCECVLTHEIAAPHP